MEEFEDSFSERMAQLEQEDIERYQRDILKNSSYSYHDETPNYVEEFRSKLPVLLDMVRGIMNDLKQKASSIENGYDLPVMNLEPDITIWDEQQPDEVTVVNEVPDSMEMLELVDIKGDDFSNSAEMPNLEDNMVSESGLKVLSIYCAHMASKWSPVLDSQPIQGNDLSVEVYYDKFCNWKQQLEVLSYIGDEQSYIDDFLWGLKRDLRIRVWDYKWKPNTLYGAFRIAEIEETIMKNDDMVFDKSVEQNDFVVLGRMASRIGADKVFVEMPHSTSIGIHGAKYVLDENVNVVLDVSGYLNVKLRLDLPAESHSLQSGKWDQCCTDAALEIMFGKIVFFKFDPGGSPLSNLKIYKQGTLIEGDEVDGGVVLYVTLQAAPGPLDDTTLNNSSYSSTKAWLEGAELIIEVVLGQKAMNKDDSSMADEMPPTFQVDVKNEQPMAPYIRGINSDYFILFDSGGKNCVVGMSGIVFSFINEAPETSIVVLQVIDGMVMFIFDPGINLLPLTGCSPLKSSEMPGSVAIALWFAIVLLSFNLDECGLFYNGCVCSEFNIDQRDWCLDTFISVLRDQDILHKPSIWRVSFGGIILLTAHRLTKNGLDDIDLVAELYADKAGLGIIPYTLDIDNDKSNGVFVLFNNLPSYVTQALGYKGVVLWVSCSNFPSTSRLELNLQVVNPSTIAIKGQLNENIGQRNLYGSMLFPSEVHFVYQTSDQASERLNNGHDISAGNSKVHFTAADMLCQRVSFGGKYCFIDFSHIHMFVNDIPAIIYLLFYSVAPRDSLYKSLFKGANFMLLSKCLCYWTLSWVRQPCEMRLVNRLGSMISLLFPLRASLAWDPGICVLVYILEDNDVCKRVGKRILAFVMISSIKDETVCQLMIWNSFPGLQMGMKEERYMLHVLIVDLLSLGSSFNHVKLFSRDFKGRVAFLKMFSTHLVKFSQLFGWSPESCYTHNSVKLGLEQIDNYANDCLRVFKSYVNKELTGHSEIICNNILMKWSSIEPHTIFYSKILKYGMDGHAFAIIYHFFEIHLAAAARSMLLTQSKREIQDCSSYDLGHFIWDPGLWSIQHYNGFLHSRSMLCALLPYPFALACCCCFGIYKCNEKCCYIEDVVWDPGARISTTLRTRRFLQGEGVVMNDIFIIILYVIPDSYIYSFMTSLN